MMCGVAVVLTTRTQTRTGEIADRYGLGSPNKSAIPLPTFCQPTR
jgi:hypothetical protein